MAKPTRVISEHVGLCDAFIKGRITLEFPRGRRMSVKPGLSFNETEIAILLYVLRKRREGTKNLYLYRIHKELEKSTSTVLDSLAKMQRKGLVSPINIAEPKYKRGPIRYYALTPFGQALAETILKRETFSHSR